MLTRRVDRVTVMWLVASALTLLSWLLATAYAGRHVTASTSEAIGALVIAAVKGRIITRDFMEVRSAPTWLRRFTDIWIMVLSAVILSMCLY